MILKHLSSFLRSNITVSFERAFKSNLFLYYLTLCYVGVGDR